MPNAIFVLPDGQRESVEVANGTHLMRAAVNHGIHAIVGDCGGSAACATCHVYVQEPWLQRLPAPSATEDQLLEATASPRQPNSRLSCQIQMSDALDGIIIDVAPTQW
ncbi:2Fe-2S iron-sulfur cluster-binding protein [Pseudomonas typographi]|uniref:(2Fe-2S)-binding protein n=1 Tax=Pseudomonas typographi TaxID=2715964 RepID=A0ABR7Z210_9PSED|nr:2Fe-2S iron-sulfur cluster-binding protein [Pseudomonas typographi]MBD1551520.1 (2Fe-2S)-binding protein [Pseudomonas typographi]MBD1587494.1 (2Fe-2S)-binding protein [Pseudomonas typographi]MBD1599423.1 (2Fe-2S)-binding protein [Pseudomonas typographi]